MATRFWVGGTGTWDLSSTTHWAATTGGASGASAPGSADTVTIDASSGTGTITPSFGGSATFQSITCGAMGMTLDFSVNNDSVTLTSNSVGFSISGSGVRTVKLGSGTFHLTGNAAWGAATTTNLTFDAGTSNLSLEANTTASVIFAGGGLTYSTVTLTANASRGGRRITGSSTIGTLSIAAGVALSFATATTTIISNAFTWTGTSSLPIFVEADGLAAAATISVASGSPTMTWAAISGLTFTGGATFVATNSLDCGGPNSGITITAPSAGGAAGMLFVPNLDGV